MNLTKNRLLLGGAAILLLGGGLTAGLVFSGDRDHTGETAEEHAAEIGAVVATKEDHHDDEEGEAQSVEIDAAGIERAGITLLNISGGTLDAEIVAQASVAAAPDGEAVLTARAAGAITEIRKRLGDPVARGEAVALVLSPDAAALSAAFSNAQSRLSLARTSFEREKTLFESRVTSRQDFEAAQAELAQAEAEHRRSESAMRAARVSGDGQSVVIASQISGRVTAVSPAAKLGAYVSPDTELFRIADPTKVQIEAAVPALDAQRIRPGDTATVEVGGRLLDAKVRSVTPAVDAASRAATVVLDLADVGAAVKPGQFARAVIRPTTQADAQSGFVLPEEAVQTVEGRDVVFVRTETGFSAVAVQTGKRSGGRVEILAGLAPGQVVAAAKAFVLKAELAKGDAAHGH